MSRTSIIAACPNCGYEVMLDTQFDTDSKHLTVYESQCPECYCTVGFSTKETEEFKE